MNPAPQPRARRARHAIRMDMTPMVDLAFLLLTFFILTTSMRRMEGLDLVVPLGAGGSAVEKRLTFLLVGPDSIYGYAGKPSDQPPVKRLGLDQVRAALGAVTDTTDLSIVVQPGDRAPYGEVVRLLEICEQKGLALHTITERLQPADPLLAVVMAPRSLP